MNDILFQEIHQRLSALEEQASLIQERNFRVESNKAWEMSRFRTLLLVAITYGITAIVFSLIGVQNFLLSALIPSVAYYVSVQSLPSVKEWWMNNKRISNHSE